MLFYEAFEYFFDGETEVFPFFFDEELADVLFFSLRHKLNSKSTMRFPVRRHPYEGDRYRRPWTSLEIDQKKSNPNLQTLKHQLEFTFQTRIRTAEAVYLRDGMDYCPFKKTKGQAAFACLFGCKREVPTDPHTSIT